MRRSMFGSIAVFCFATVVAFGAPVGSGRSAALDRVSGDAGSVAGELTCLCGIDVDGTPICFRADPCPFLETCEVNADCDAGEACVIDCCILDGEDFGGFCVNVASCTNFFTICDDPQICTEDDSILSACTPRPTGTCCGPTFQACFCRITTELDCAAIGGNYEGDDTTCENANDLPVIGELTLAECYDTIREAGDAVEAAIQGVSDICPNNLIQTNQTGCVGTIDATVTDICDNAVEFDTVTVTIDPTAPMGTCSSPDFVSLSANECEAEIEFSATITDNCCVDADSVMVTATLASGAATLEVDEECEVTFPNGEDVAEVSCVFEVSNITECPAVVQFTVKVADCCGNEATIRCPETVEVRDITVPMITHCPEPIVVDRGEKICNSAIQEWLDSFTATDNCPGGRVYESEDLDLPIPDNNLTGLIETIDVPDSFIIEDVNIGLSIDHTRVGDLVVLIFHLPNGFAFIDQPGLPPAPCTADDFVDIILDDEGALPLEAQCMNGLSSPPNYTPHFPLSVFDGQDAQGQWSILVVDRATGEIGTLGEWSLHFNGGPTLSNNAPTCGFPPGTTEVEFKATDTCGNMATCTSSVTVDPFDRFDISKKGSFLAFSKIEIQWEDQQDGSQLLIKDTFLDITNDYPGPVLVQAYFINGDIQQEELRDFDGEIIQPFEPGWNTADCLFTLTPNQPHYWSAVNGSDKCQPFVVLDEDGPGRINPETDNPCRVLRGYAVFYAVRLKPTNVAGSNAEYEEIRWNHLKGDAVIVDYSKGTAEEYNAWAAAASDCVGHGEALLNCRCYDGNGICCDAEVRPGRLAFDGFQYDLGFESLLLDFYASGSTVFSGGGSTVMLDTQLTLHTLSADLRQDGGGPILTKVDAEIWNEFESKFSGSRRCLCCWDSTFLSDWSRSAVIPNHFTQSALRTEKGKARLTGNDPQECDYEEICGRERRLILEMVPVCPIVRPPPVADPSRITALLGISTKFLSFSGPSDDMATAAMNLVGTGLRRGLIRTDFDGETDELRDETARQIEAPSRAPSGREKPSGSR